MAGVNVSEASDDSDTDEDQDQDDNQSLVAFRAAELTEACVETIEALRAALPENTESEGLIRMAHAILFAAREDEEKLLVRTHREEMANASAHMCETMTGLMTSIRDDIRKRREEAAVAKAQEDAKSEPAQATAAEDSKSADTSDAAAAPAANA